MKKSDFSEDDKIKCLLWCNRHCSLCGKPCGTNIEIAHIIPKGKNTSSNDIDNAIPLCYNCHAEIGRYNKNHPRGNKYRDDELKARRNQIYEEQTRHLVPPIHYSITQALSNGQKRKLPDVGFIISNLGDSLPVKVFVHAQIFLGEQQPTTPAGDHYSKNKTWNLNPRFSISGHFSVPDKAVTSTERLKINVTVNIIDKYGREHELLPLEWVFKRDSNEWYLEP